MSRSLFSLVESSAHPNLSALYQRLEIRESKFNSSRKLIAKLKTQRPDFLVAEFFYGYGNNYAGVNISNLDVILFSMQKYSPHTRVIVLVSKDEREQVDKLNGILPLHAVLTQPVGAAEMEAALAGDDA